MILGRDTKSEYRWPYFFCILQEKPFFLVFNCQIFSIMFRHCEKLLSVKTLSTKNSFDVLKLLILQLHNRFSYFYLFSLKLTFSVFLISVILKKILLVRIFMCLVFSTPLFLRSKVIMGLVSMSEETQDWFYVYIQNRFNDSRFSETSSFQSLIILNFACKQGFNFLCFYGSCFSYFSISTRGNFLISFLAQSYKWFPKYFTGISLNSQKFSLLLYVSRRLCFLYSSSV